jgi:hypothetical protein
MAQSPIQSYQARTVVSGSHATILQGTGIILFETAIYNIPSR